MNRQKFHFCASKTDNKHSVFMYGSSLAYFAPHPREFHVPPRKITVFRFTRLILLKAAKRAIWIDLVCFRFFRFLLSLIIFRVAARTSVRNAPDPAISCAFFPNSRLLPETPLLTPRVLLLVLLFTRCFCILPAHLGASCFATKKFELCPDVCLSTLGTASAATKSAPRASPAESRCPTAQTALLPPLGTREES